jgi:hypothetical protein
VTDTGTRTGIVYLQNDGADSYTLYRTSIRNIVAALEAKGALASQTALGSRPSAGAGLRFWKDSGSLGDGVLYYDNGSTWEAIGTAAAVDAAAGVGSLRTLGAGALQAAAGNHTHAIGAITGTGDSVTKSVGTSSGTVAAGDHTHASSTLGFQYVTKASATSRTSTTTLTDDPDLRLTLAAGTYHLTALLSASGEQGADIQVFWNFTGTWTQTLRGTQGPSSTVTAVQSGGDMLSWVSGSAGTPTYGTSSGAVWSFIREELIVVVTGSGSARVQWAQAVSNSNPTAMEAGSTLIAQKLA